MVQGCVFAGNKTTMSTGGGGGMAVYIEGDPLVTDCVFSANRTGREGGGMAFAGTGTATIRHTIFAGNVADMFG